MQIFLRKIFYAHKNKGARRLSVVKLDYHPALGINVCIDNSSAYILHYLLFYDFTFSVHNYFVIVCRGTEIEVMVNGFNFFI